MCDAQDVESTFKVPACSVSFLKIIKNLEYRNNNRTNIAAVLCFANFS